MTRTTTMAGTISARPRPLPHARTFYTTALVVTLFACYSIVKHTIPAVSERNARLTARALLSQDLEVLPHVIQQASKTNVCSADLSMELTEKPSAISFEPIAPMKKLASSHISRCTTARLEKQNLSGLRYSWCGSVCFSAR